MVSRINSRLCYNRLPYYLLIKKTNKVWVDWGISRDIWGSKEKFEFISSLTTPKKDLSFHLYCNVNVIIVRSISYQFFKNKKKKEDYSIIYVSHQLNGTRKNYSTIERVFDNDFLSKEIPSLSFE